MTILAVLSDIHGNLPALEAALDDLQQFSVDHIVVAGDVVNWGPFSAEVMARITREGFAAIRGNNELYLLDYGTPRAPAHWREYTVPPWTHQQLGDRWLSVIAAWPDTLCLRFRDAPPIRVVHGSPRSPWEGIYAITPSEAVEDMLTDAQETTLIAGHTHLPLERRVGRWHILNPGSVGIPLDGTAEASYMLLEGDGNGWRPAFQRVPYSNETLFHEFERKGFIESCGPIARLIMEEFRTSRLQVYPFQRWRAAHHPDEPVTMALLEAFATVDPWEYTPPEYHVNLPADGRGAPPREWTNTER